MVPFFNIKVSQLGDCIDPDCSDRQRPLFQLEVTSEQLPEGLDAGWQADSGGEGYRSGWET